jgi:hypothetical protein
MWTLDCVSYSVNSIAGQSDFLAYVLCADEQVFSGDRTLNSQVTLYDYIKIHVFFQLA